MFGTEPLDTGRAELLRVDDVARMLDLHPVTVRKHIREGRLPGVRLWRELRVRRSDVERIIAEGFVGRATR